MAALDAEAEGKEGGGDLKIEREGGGERKEDLTRERERGREREI